MALVACIECGKEVSDKAAACIGCGAPVGSSVGAGTPVITTQGTSKYLKAQQLIAAGIAIFGLLGTCGAVSENDNSLASFNAGLFWIGIIWFVIVKIRIWWHHK